MINCMIPEQKLLIDIIPMKPRFDRARNDRFRHLYRLLNQYAYTQEELEFFRREIDVLLNKKKETAHE